MDIADLSLWDWVIYDDNIVRVCSINGDNTLLVGWVDEDYPKTTTTTIEHIKPIVLTEEILKLNNFILTPDGYWELPENTDDPGLILYKISNAFVIPTAGLAIAITYVHELQSILKIIGYKISVNI